MTDYLRIENHPELIKDTKSGAVVANDKAAFDAYINRVNKQRNDAKRLDKLEADVSDVKDLLREILQRLT